MDNIGEGNLTFKQIGRRIRQCRIGANLTQEQLAESAGISQKHLSRIEKGYHNPHFDVIVSLARILCVPVDAFVRDFEFETTDAFLYVIQDDIRKMSGNQREMLKDNIAIIKRYHF